MKQGPWVNGFDPPGFTNTTLSQKRVWLMILAQKPWPLQGESPQSLVPEADPCQNHLEHF